MANLGKKRKPTVICHNCWEVTDILYDGICAKCFRERIGGEDGPEMGDSKHPHDTVHVA